MESFGSSRIVGIGAYLPKQRVTTDELMREVNSRRFGIPEDYISRHIGITEKRVADSRDQPSDLAVLASEIALRDAGVTADEIDLIIYTGVSRDYIEPATAHSVQMKLGASRSVCMDVSNACVGFMTGILIADGMIIAGSANRALVCTGEKHVDLVNGFIRNLKTISQKKDFKSRLGMLTLGDAGAAVVLERSPARKAGLQWIGFESQGLHHKLCYLNWTNEGIDGEMDMQKISRETVALHADLLNKTYKKLEWTASNVDKLYAHQVGKKPYLEMLEGAGIAKEFAPITYEHFGNMASATIPVSMYLHPPQRGDNVLVIGAGSGITICQAGYIF